MPLSAPAAPARTLAIADFQKLAYGLAHQIAFQPMDVDDLVQEGLLAFHHALTRTPSPDKPGAFATAVMRRAMWRYNLQPWVADVRRASPLPEDDGGEGSRHMHRQFDILESPTPRYIVDMGPNESALAMRSLDRFQAVAKAVRKAPRYTKAELDYLRGLEKSYGARARAVAENLLDPQDPKLKKQLNKAIDHEIARHQNAPCEVCGFVHWPEVRISNNQVRRAMKLTYANWFLTLQQIKCFTRRWLLVRGHVCDEPCPLHGDKDCREVAGGEPHGANRRSRAGQLLAGQGADGGLGGAPDSFSGAGGSSPPPRRTKARRRK